MQTENSHPKVIPSGALTLAECRSTRPSLQRLVDAMSAEVNQLIACGQVPADITSFSALHDHCDANCLGGVCEDEIFDCLITMYGGRDVEEGMPSNMVLLLNTAQSEIDRWLAAGRPAAWPVNEARLQPLRGLLCCCCGSRIRGRQHFNQDAGFGLGPCCVEFVRSRVEDMERTYGVPGVHYFPEGTPVN